MKFIQWNCNGILIRDIQTYKKNEIANIQAILPLRHLARIVEITKKSKLVVLAVNHITCQLPKFTVNDK